MHWLELSELQRNQKEKPQRVNTQSVKPQREKQRAVKENPKGLKPQLKTNDYETSKKLEPQKRETPDAK